MEKKGIAQWPRDRLTQINPEEGGEVEGGGVGGEDRGTDRDESTETHPHLLECSLSLVTEGYSV